MFPVTWNSIKIRPNQIKNSTFQSKTTPPPPKKNDFLNAVCLSPLKFVRKCCITMNIRNSIKNDFGKLSSAEMLGSMNP